MQYDNSDLVGKLPKSPHKNLQALGSLLLGRWHMHGPTIDGFVEFDWLEGKFFLVHRFDLHAKDENPRGVEFIGWNEKTGTIRSQLYGVDGSRFTYTWELRHHRLTTWSGEQGSVVRSIGKVLSQNQIEAAWKGPEGGYSYTLDRKGYGYLILRPCGGACGAGRLAKAATRRSRDELAVSTLSEAVPLEDHAAGSCPQVATEPPATASAPTRLTAGTGPLRHSPSSTPRG